MAKKPYKCSCGKRFRHLYLMIRHMRIEKREICPECFSLIRTTTGEHSEEFLHCPDCRKFKERYHNINHFNNFKSKMMMRHSGLQNYISSRLRSLEDRAEARK